MPTLYQCWNAKLVCTFSLCRAFAHKYDLDAEFDRTFNPEQSGQEGSIEATLQHDETWDEWDDEDAEGDNEEDWIDPDADSNESSITLSSKASSKRTYEEVDPSEEPYVENPQDSPGPLCAVYLISYVKHRRRFKTAARPMM